MTCLFPLALMAIWSGVLDSAAVVGAGKDEQTAADKRVLRDARVGLDGPALLAYFRERTLTPEAQKIIATLIQDLGDRSYRARHRASVLLGSRGSVAVAALRAALDNADLEVVRRASNALRRIKDGDLGPALSEAAARQLARIKPAGAAPALLDFVPFAVDESVAAEAVQALAALAVRNGKLDMSLVAALDEKDPVKRAAAAVALVRAAPIEQRPRLRKLLHDQDSAVRMQVAVALAFARDKDAIPILIDLLDRLPPARAYLAQDFLFQIAGDNAPGLPLGATEEDRARCKAGWTAWWRKHGNGIDLAKLTEKPRLLGYTMLVLLDAGKIQERDAEGNQRWEVEGFQLPLDAQLLPGNRLLVAEHGGNRVTERNLKGEVLWEKKIPQPLMAQRLPSGNTFICTRTEMIEIDRAGKEVHTWPSPNGSLLSRATRLPNGDIVCVTLDELNGQLFRLTPTGKQKQTFLVNVTTSGGRIEVLANGHILIPEMIYNRVIEYDGSGKVVWMARVRQPVAAVRLANGNTLVTTYSQNRAIELDKKGEETAEFRTDTRVTRAWRR